MNSGQLRVSDADRDSVAEVLHTAYAEGRITLDEHAERTGAALQARTFADLVPLTDDLVPADRPAAPALPYELSTPDRITALFSDSKRRGPWTVGRQLQVNVFFGDVELDLTEATFTGREVEISCTQCLGQITIRVRPGTTVRVDAANVLADSSVKQVGPPEAGGATVVVRGTNILGDIKVRGPRRPSRWRRQLA